MIISPQLLASLKSKDQRVQLKAAKDFYACLINELKQVKPDNETNFVDSLIPDIRKLANDANPYSDKQACIYIITSIINLDNINVKVSKKHQTSFFRWLKNLLPCQDPTVIHMASRAMGKYAQAGVECDVEFKSGLENLRIESKRFQGILLVKELALASPSRLFLNSDLFYQNIMFATCDRSPEIRYEAIELFRLSLIISISRESLDTNSANFLDKRNRRVSTSSSCSSLSVRPVN
jgi:FKBP12-rapamycin complex-associated protein